MVPRNVKLFIGLALAAGVTVGVTACNPLQAITEEGVEQAIEGATGGNVDIDAGAGVSIPADFPSDVPIIDATLFSSVSLGSGAEQTWNLIFNVSDAQAAYADAVSMLTGAGYAEVAQTESAEGSFGSFANDAWSVTVSAVPAMGGEEPKLSYTVIQNTLQ